LLINPKVSEVLLEFHIAPFDTGIDTAPEAAMVVIAFCYVVAACFNLFIPDTGARYAKQSTNPITLLVDFSHCFVALWRDKLGQISLAVTTLFWGAGATLQFIVLKWAELQLGLPLDQGAILQGVVAVGIAIGAVVAARYVPLKRSLSALPWGVAMGLIVMLMVFVKSPMFAYPLCIAVGAIAGFFVVPLNALLQHRGHVMLSAGHSIAVQNFNENLNILVMLALYALMIRADMPINTVILLFGAFVSGAMLLIIFWNRANHRNHDLDAMIGEAKH
jgi:MFS transporter, LPLT family, lysophospholipid transporter